MLGDSMLSSSSCSHACASCAPVIPDAWLWPVQPSLASGMRCHRLVCGLHLCQSVHPSAFKSQRLPVGSNGDAAVCTAILYGNALCAPIHSCRCIYLMLRTPFVVGPPVIEAHLECGPSLLARSLPTMVHCCNQVCLSQVVHPIVDQLQLSSGTVSTLVA
jgi:hypothetical protein